MKIFHFGWGYQDNQDNSDGQELTSWQKLADSYGLTFSSAYWWTPAQIVGNYRGHHLRVYAHYSSKGYHDTSIKIDVNRPDDNLSSKNKQHPGDILNVKEVTRLLIPHGLRYQPQGEIKIKTHGQKIIYKQHSFANDINYLRFLLNLLGNLAYGYHKVVELGGEAVPALQSIVGDARNVLRPIALELLKDIAHETKNRLSYQPTSFLCPRCLTHPDTYVVQIYWWRTVDYYGCRTCGQSRAFLEKRAVAILDREMTTEQSEQNGDLWINWLLNRRLFDFSEVQILQATDKDVETFAVQVGNDTAKKRKKRYRQIQCIISADCDELSENTMRVLRHMFGAVEIRKQLQSQVSRQKSS